MGSDSANDIDVKGLFAEQANDLQDDGFTQTVMDKIHAKEKVRHRLIVAFSCISIVLSGAGIWALDWRFSSLWSAVGENTLLVGTLVTVIAICLPPTLEE